MDRCPFSPQLLDALPDELAELFRELEMTLLVEICSRLNLTGQLNEVTLQDIRALRSHGIDLKDIKKAIQKATGTGMDGLNKMLDDAVERNQQYYTNAIDLAGLTQPDSLVEAADIVAIVEQCQREYGNITRSMGFLVDNGRTMLEPAKAYQWALDNATMQVQSGAISYEQAIKGAIKQLSDSGLKTVSYESGHVDSVDTAVRRAVMTGINQLNRKYTEQSIDFLETDLVQVEAHYGARNVPGPNGWEDHESWQGKIYRWAAYTRRYPNASTGEYKDFEQTCGYGDVTGILGANCRHTYSPFVEGVMEPSYTKEELEAMKAENNKVTYDGKTYDGYQATQMQRRLERTIRKQKRLVNACKAAGLKEDAQSAQVRLNRLNTKYTEFSKAAKLPEYTERKNVAYIGQKTMEKAGRLKVQRDAEAAAKELRNQQNRAILNEKIQGGEIPTTIRPQVQARHIEGTAEFDRYLEQRLAKGYTPQSILTVTMEEAQELVDRYNCTGTVSVTERKDGSFQIKEFKTVDKIIGKYFKDNEYREASRMMVIYSKKGTHIVPVSPKEDR